MHFRKLRYGSLITGYWDFHWSEHPVDIAICNKSACETLTSKFVICLNTQWSTCVQLWKLSWRYLSLIQFLVFTYPTIIFDNYENSFTCMSWTFSKHLICAPKLDEMLLCSPEYSSENMSMRKCLNFPTKISHHGVTFMAIKGNDSYKFGTAMLVLVSRAKPVLWAFWHEDSDCSCNTQHPVRVLSGQQLYQLNCEMARWCGDGRWCC